MIQQLRQRLEQTKGQRQQVLQDIASAQAKLEALAKQGIRIERVQAIYQIVAQQTQGRLTYYINDMVTAAVEAVFPEDDYKFFLEFVQRRNKTEADLFLANHEGKRISIADNEAGGLILIVSFALRIALWSLAKGSRPVFILDEPAHFIHSREMHSKFAELLKTISERLGLQIIMVTGEDESEEIIAGADRVIRIKKTKGISSVTVNRPRS